MAKHPKNLPPTTLALSPLQTPLPTSSAIPVRLAPVNVNENDTENHAPHRLPKLPKLRLEIRDLIHPGAEIFLEKANRRVMELSVNCVGLVPQQKILSIIDRSLLLYHTTPDLTD
jgi:hypothetical protein